MNQVKTRLTLNNNRKHIPDLFLNNKEVLISKKRIIVSRVTSKRMERLFQCNKIYKSYLRKKGVSLFFKLDISLQRKVL